MRNGFTLIELPSAREGFTLIELLVVITIIVVLLALLVPAMERAIYQAQLAVCGSRQHAIANSAVIYAMDQKRFYPPMPPASDQFKPNRLTNGNAPASDRRINLKTFLSINEALNDPLTPLEMDFESPKMQYSHVFVSYNLWFGWRYLKNTGGPEAGMRKLGDRFTFTSAGAGGQTVVNRFSLLAGDIDTYSPTSPGRTETNHPDSPDLQHGESGQDAPFYDPTETAAGIGWTFSRWINSGTDPIRGLLDNHHAYDDGSVRRFDGVEVQDKRMTSVSLQNNGDVGTQGLRLYIPTND